MIEQAMTNPPKSARQFEAAIEIAAPRDAVWRALATPEGLAHWFAPAATVEARPGGEIAWDWGENHRWVQRVEILEPGRRLLTRYDSPVDDGEGGKRPLFVDFVLEGDGGTTTLRLVQSGFGAEASFDEEYDGISRGWPIELGSLRLALERHAGEERHLSWRVAAVGGDPDAAWQRLTGPDGLACGSEIAALREGDAFRFTTVDGDVFEGTALTCDARGFSGVATSHGDAFLRFSVENCGSQNVWLWLATYGDRVPEADALGGRLDALLGRLFGAVAQ